ncbi:MAG: alcohol dehydrogenase catalytic domain-containing protein [Methanophagales archaeon]|nr:alcohol dehydrogenase catalytic domain-containing protein [Methanophagales archaeon]
MRTISVKVPFKIRIEDVPIPIPGRQEVLVRIRACGLCGSDVLSAEKLAKDRFMPVGHEITGEIVGFGEGVKGLQKGEKVVLENSTFCGVCENCKNGSPDCCKNPYTFNEQSGFADYICVHNSCLHICEDLSSSAAVLVEPLSVALDLISVTNIQLNEDVAIIGPGPIGLLAVRLAKMRGAREVYLAGNSHSKARLKIGLELGADRIIEVDKMDLSNYVQDNNPEGFAKVIVTAPPRAIVDAINISKYSGIISYLGIDYGGGEIVKIDANKFHFKKLQLRASFSKPKLMYPIAIDLIKRGIVPVNRFVTHTFSLSQIEEAFKTIKTNKEETIKIAILTEE